MTLLRKALAIKDNDIDDAILDFDFAKNYNKVVLPDTIIKQHKKWIAKSQNFKIDLDFEYCNVTHGITDAFNDFYFLHKNIFVLEGEYNYHRDIGIKEIGRIGEIEPNSALIISYPFSATGTVHPDWQNIINVCESLNISVFLDLCLFGVAYDCELVIPKCVTHCAFSFSKAFNTGSYRTGFLYTREKYNTPLFHQNLWIYNNQLGSLIHQYLMHEFNVDYIVDKYKLRSVEICNEHNINPTNTVIFGTSNDDKWNKFERTIINRMCLSHILSV